MSPTVLSRGPAQVRGKTITHQYPGRVWVAQQYARRLLGTSRKYLKEDGLWSRGMPKPLQVMIVKPAGLIGMDERTALHRATRFFPVLGECLADRLVDAGR